MGTYMGRAIRLLHEMNTGDAELKRKRQDIRFMLDSGSTVHVGNWSAVQLMGEMTQATPMNIMTANGKSRMRFKGKVKMGKASITDIWLNMDMENHTGPMVILSEGSMVEEYGWKITHGKAEGKQVWIEDRDRKTTAQTIKGISYLSREQVMTIMNQHTSNGESGDGNPEQDTERRAKLQRMARELLTQIAVGDINLS